MSVSNVDSLLIGIGSEESAAYVSEMIRLVGEHYKKEATLEIYTRFMRTSTVVGFMRRENAKYQWRDERSQKPWRKRIRISTTPPKAYVDAYVQNEIDRARRDYQAAVEKDAKGS